MSLNVIIDVSIEYELDMASVACGIASLFL